MNCWAFHLHPGGLHALFVRAIAFITCFLWFLSAQPGDLRLTKQKSVRSDLGSRSGQPFRIMTPLKWVNLTTVPGSHVCREETV